MATFRRTIKNFDNIPDAYNYYGELLLDQQKYSEAIEKFDTAIDLEKQTKSLAMNVLPIINKALALFQWKQDSTEAEKLCQKALISGFHGSVLNTLLIMSSRSRLRCCSSDDGAITSSTRQSDRCYDIL